MGVRLRSRDQTAKCGMAHEKFSSSEESTHEQIQGENNDFFFSTAVALCTKNLYLQDRELTLQRGVTGTARMLHALTHSSIPRQVREQM